MFKYKINVLQSLKDANYNTYRLRSEKILGEHTIQDLRKDKVVGIKSLDIICGILKMQPGEIIEWVEE